YGLDEGAVNSLKGWRFRPGMKDGTPVRVVITVEMSYALGGSSGAAPRPTTPGSTASGGDAPVPLAWPAGFSDGTMATPGTNRATTAIQDAFPQSTLDVRFSYSPGWSVITSSDGITLYAEDSKGTRAITVSSPRPANFVLDQPLSRLALDGFTLAAG